MDIKLILEIILNYLKVIISWPLVGIIFLCKFYDSIRKFLEGTRLRKFGPAEFEEKQEKVESPTEKESLKRDKETDIEKKDRLIQLLTQRNEFYEFSYLNLFFVLNTKSVLLWFYKRAQATKDLYNLEFQQQIPDPKQREIIFNVLIYYKVIETTDGGEVFKISEKGIKFLKFIKSI